MPTNPLPLAVLFLVAVASLSPPAAALGSASTFAVSYASATVCGIVAGEPTRRIQCSRAGQSFPVLPKASFEALSGGRSFFCGLLSGGLSLVCWDAFGLRPKRIYHSETVRLTELTVGDSQVCAIIAGTGAVKCWRGSAAAGAGDGCSFPSPAGASEFRSITSGVGFSCGILKNNSRVFCWGNRGIGSAMQRDFGSMPMLSLVAGESHVCGLNSSGFLICKGDNEAGQLNVPTDSAFEYSGLALGANHTCATRRENGLAVCWGGGAGELKFMSSLIENVSFESIAAGSDFTCGLKTATLSLICWGPGWLIGDTYWGIELPLPMVIPGPCVEAPCFVCGVYPNSESLCCGHGNICKSCEAEAPLTIPLPLPAFPHPSPPLHQALPPPPPPLPSPSLTHHRKAVAIVGSVGAFLGLCFFIFCLHWTKLCGLLHRKIHHSTETIAAGINAGALSSKSGAVVSRSLRRQRSGTSSSKHPAERAKKFSLSELAAATGNFSSENKIGSGSFGTVYKGRLKDGHEVAIKRGETTCARKKRRSQDKEIAFDSELVLLSRLHHKHLVALVGFCRESDERLLVYEYMSNGALYDHLHSKNNTRKSSSILNSWKMRIKIALDAARGIEYLHNYAVPTIIHRDIKSSNILLDANWTGRVSDFGLSLMGSECDEEGGFVSTEAVGTVGYIDPEYYVLNVLTTKSDVYGLGVVLLELLTGKKAVFRNEEDGADPIGVVEYAVPKIGAGEVRSILDVRVGLPEVNEEAEAVRMVAYAAMQCVSLEVRRRPAVAEIAANLEGALALCESSHGSISNSSFLSSYNSE